MQIRVFGDLAVVAPGNGLLTLPASRKARALLGYLAVSRREHQRGALCDLLWTEAEDPRGALRWCLSRLKAAAPGCIEADRRRLVVGDVEVDLHLARRLLAAGPANTDLPKLEQAAALFRGELLEGLDLLDDYRFHAWCTAEREAARQLHRRILVSLSERLEDGTRALEYASTLVAIDPLDETANTRVIRLLSSQGRHQDAHDQLQTFKRVTRLELGEAPHDAVRRMRRIMHQEPLAAPPPPEVTPVTDIALVGRDETLNDLLGWARGDGPAVCLVMGEAGMGKSRLLDELEGQGIRGMRIRAHRNEMKRPLGPWLDALGDGGIAGQGFTDRSALFEVIRARVLDCSKGRIFIDDLQWSDETSLALTSVLARTSGLRLLLTARPGELVDNPPAFRLLEDWRLERTAAEHPLAPLSAEAITEICRLAAPDADLVSVLRRSAGNPFVALQLARASVQATRLPDGLQALLRERIERLSAPCQKALPWIAALGHDIQVDLLARVLESAIGVAALPVLDELEANAVLTPTAVDTYGFGHELLREAAYLALSGPRRRLLHRSLARLLDTPEMGAIELLRHAELAGDRSMAARVCARAAAESFAMCAWPDAFSLADRGLHHLEATPGDRGEVGLALLTTRIRTASVLCRSHPGQVFDSLQALLTEALDEDQRSTAFHLLSVLHEEEDELDMAARDTERAASAVQGATARARGHQMANTARCLLHIEREPERARELLGQAASLIEPSGEVEWVWGQGLMAEWDGDAEKTVTLLEQALSLARRIDDRWREASILTKLAMVVLEQGDRERAAALAAAGLAHDGGEQLKTPILRTILTLSRGEDLSADLQHLRQRDAKAHLAWALERVAELALEAGDLDAARAAATEARDLAQLVLRMRSMRRSERLLRVIDERPE